MTCLNIVSSAIYIYSHIQFIDMFFNHMQLRKRDPRKKKKRSFPESCVKNLKLGDVRYVSLRFVPHGKFTWKLYPHPLLLQPEPFLYSLPHNPPCFSQHFIEQMFSGMFAESLCKSGDIGAKKKVAKQAVSVSCLFQIQIALIYELAQSPRHSGMQQEDLIQHIWS